MNKKVSYYFSALVIVLLFFISSCKTDPSSSSETVDTNKPFTVVSHLSSDPEGLNPITATAVYSRSVTNQIFSNLVHYDVQTLKPSPMLIKEMPRVEELSDSEYQLASHYEILEEAVWDNGKPITGHDVDFTIKLMLNPKVPADALRPFVERLKHIEIDKSNPKKFIIYSDNYFLATEIFTNFPILPEYIYDEKGLLKNITIKQLSDTKERSALEKSNKNLQQFADEFISSKYNREVIVGSGPYKLEEWITGQRLVLKKKENWWGNNLGKKNPLLQAYPTEIVFRPISDMTTAVTELKGEAIDLMATIPSKEFTDLKENASARANLNLHSVQEFIYYYIGMNRKSPKLADKKVRRAIAHLVDVQELIDVVMYGEAKRTVGPFHFSKPYYHKDLPLIELNIEKAKKLLAEAGWKDSNNNGIVDKTINGKLIEMNLEFQTSKGGAGGRIGTLVQAHAKKAGVKINVVEKDFNSLKSSISERKYELAASAWGQDPSLNDPKQIWHTSSDTPSGANRVGFGNAASDKIIEEIQQTAIETTRNQLYRTFQEMVYEDQPYVFLFFRNGRAAINKKFDATPSSRKPGIFENQFRLNKGDVSMN